MGNLNIDVRLQNLPPASRLMARPIPPLLLKAYEEEQKAFDKISIHYGPGPNSPSHIRDSEEYDSPETVSKWEFRQGTGKDEYDRLHQKWSICLDKIHSILASGGGR